MKKPVAPREPNYTADYLKSKKDIYHLETGQSLNQIYTWVKRYDLSEIYLELGDNPSLYTMAIAPEYVARLKEQYLLDVTNYKKALREYEAWCKKDKLAKQASKLTPAQEIKLLESKLAQLKGSKVNAE